MEYKKISLSTNIIEHLGRNLITAPEVAFVELIKNSLDASIRTQNKAVRISYFDSINDISNMLVNVNESIFELLPEKYKNKNFFVIEDMGCGMDEKTLEEGFLSVGTDIKKRNRILNEEIVLGEKGIGRLATQRLGSFLLVETASEKEEYVNVVAIEWEDVLNETKISDLKVPYKKLLKKNNSYTRLWIFDVDENDLVREDGQIELFKDYSKIVLNEELDNAICFLISPFSENKEVEISFYYNGHEIKYGFEKKMLDFAETVHQFVIDIDAQGELCLNLNLEIRPWLIYRIHRACILPTSEFGKYKKKNSDYEKLLSDCEKKFNGRFKVIITKNDLLDFLVRDAKRDYDISEKNDNASITEYLEEKINLQLNELRKILPIRGQIYSYKKDAFWCKTVLDFCEESTYNVKNIQMFLKIYNGVKLYRDKYRIGFLGNRDNDWIKFQQYRTQGHQFYRFNLGTTLGEIVINDPHQQYIKEISSRLDVNKSEISNIFMKVVEKICNYYFYDFNGALTEMVKDILDDKGWLQGNIKQKVIKEEKTNEFLLKQNRALKLQLDKTKEVFYALETSDDGKKIIQDDQYNMALETLEFSDKHIEMTKQYIENNAEFVKETKARYEKIEIEAFNNYKLMANGLITETITHELHSLVSTKGTYNMEHYFGKLTEYLWETNMVLYNKNLLPIRDTYFNVAKKLDEVSDLYKFLENTFIKNNSMDEYEVVNVQNTMVNIQRRLEKELKRTKIALKTKEADMNWYLPKGVLLHVLYNLINNSKYWIDVRRKRARNDKTYYSEESDYVMLEGVGIDAIVVYDSGTGVKKEMEEVLFQALQSGKGPDGRGMGLYIVQKLLSSFGARIELLEERNKYGNRYKFLITVPQDSVK